MEFFVCYDVGPEYFLNPAMVFILFQKSAPYSRVIRTFFLKCVSLTSN